MKNQTKYYYLTINIINFNYFEFEVKTDDFIDLSYLMKNQINYYYIIDFESQNANCINSSCFVKNYQHYYYITIMITNFNYFEFEFQTNYFIGLSYLIKFDFNY